MNDQELPSDALCTICGEPATTYLGRTKVLPLCSLASCEAALTDEINFELALSTDSANQQGAAS